MDALKLGEPSSFDPDPPPAASSQNPRPRRTWKKYTGYWRFEEATLRNCGKVRFISRPLPLWWILTLPIGSFPNNLSFFMLQYGHYMYLNVNAVFMTHNCCNWLWNLVEGPSINLLRCYAGVIAAMRHFCPSLLLYQVGARSNHMDLFSLIWASKRHISNLPGKKRQRNTILKKPPRKHTKGLIHVPQKSWQHIGRYCYRYCCSSKSISKHQDSLWPCDISCIISS